MAARKKKAKRKKAAPRKTLVSQRAYGRYRKCSHSAVQTAIRSGRISKAVVDDDHGRPKIHLELADKLWDANTNPTLQREKAGKPVPKNGRRIKQAVIPGTEEDVERIEAAEKAQKEPKPEDPEAKERREQVHEASAKKLNYQAELARLEYERRLGDQFSRKEVETYAERVAAIVKDGMLAFPDRLGGMVADESDKSVCIALIREEVSALLEKMAKALAHEEGF